MLIQVRALPRVLFAAQPLLERMRFGTSARCPSQELRQLAIVPIGSTAHVSRLHRFAPSLTIALLLGHGLLPLLFSTLAGAPHLGQPRTLLCCCCRRLFDVLAAAAAAAAGCGGVASAALVLAAVDVLLALGKHLLGGAEVCRIGWPRGGGQGRHALCDLPRTKLETVPFTRGSARGNSGSGRGVRVE